MPPTKTTWRKTRHSDGQGGACVEVASVPGGTGVRDSKNPGAGHLTISQDAFHTLLTNLKR